MNNLIFPTFDYKIKHIEGKANIFDIIRKKYIVITPEEWIRQHLIHFLINQMNYPRSLIKVEDGMKLNKMSKRSDLVIYDRKGNIFLVVECKSAKVRITQKSMDQLSNYNQNYKANYLALTNGLVLFVCQMDYKNKTATFIEDFPKFH